MADSENQAGWAYRPDNQEPVLQNTDPATKEATAPTQKSVSWTASEFIDKHKGTGWYVAFILGILLISFAIFIVTKDYMSTAVIIIAGIIFLFVIKKKPQQLPYELNERGLQIGSKFYQYEMFKSFDLTQDEGLKSIDLIPIKRFMPEISIYFPPDQELLIVNILASHLPHNPQPEKTVDRLAKKLRF